MKTITRRESAQADAFHSIPTSYNGLRFRSRLEARTAIVMDCLGIPYQYEPEGFQMGSVRYLPDFYLPEQDAYLELKPPTQDLSVIWESYRKARMLSEGMGKCVIILTGECGNTRAVKCIPGGFQAYICSDGSKRALEDFSFTHCSKCYKAGISSEILGCWSCSSELRFTANSEAAYAIARRVRFDHPNWKDATPERYRTLWSLVLNQPAREQADWFRDFANTIEAQS